MASRSTRARSRANAGNETPDTRQAAYSEPPSADLPSLYPMHDGSYGVNTHVNLDNVRRRRGRKPTSDLINEDDEDRRFTRRIRGRDGNRFNMENDLRKVAEETVEEASKGERASEDPDDHDDIWLDPSLHPQDKGPGVPAGSSRPVRVLEEPFGDSEEIESIPPVSETITSYIPKMSGARFFPNPDDRSTPPHDTTRYRSADPYSLIHNREPSAPPISLSPFFGPSSGTGYLEGNTSWRPGSSKSFIGEGTLYGDASVYTNQSQGVSQPENVTQPDSTSQPGAISQPKTTSQPGTSQSQPQNTSVSTAPTSGIFSGLTSWSTSNQHTSHGQTPSSVTSGPKQPTYEEVTDEESTSRQPADEQLTHQQPPTSQQPTHPPPPIGPGQGSSYGLFGGRGGSSTISNSASGGSSFIGKTNNTPSNVSGSSAPYGLSPAEWHTVSNFIQGLRHPSLPQATGGIRRGPIEPLDHLSQEEIQATKSLIRDMGKDPVTVSMILDELDRVANLAGPPKSDVKSLSADQPPPPLPPIDEVESITAPGTGTPFSTNAPTSVGGFGSTTTPGYGGSPSNNTPTFMGGAGPTTISGSSGGNLGKSNNQTSGLTKQQGENSGYGTDSRTVDRSTKTPGPATNTQQVPLQKSNRPSRRRRTSFTKWVADKWDAILVFLTVLTGVWVFLTFINRGSLPAQDDILNRPGIQWPQWSAIRNNVIQAIPSGIRNPLGTFWEYTSSPTRGGAIPDIGGLVNTPSQLANDLAEEIAPNIPGEVYVQRDRNGKLKISQDFWHALKELMRGDDIVLTLGQAQGQAATISDTHWIAIRNRLESSGLLRATNTTARPAIPVSTGQTDTMLAWKNCEDCWNKWLRKNKEALRKAVSEVVGTQGPGSGVVIPQGPGSDPSLPNQSGSGVALTKEQFMDLFKKEVESHTKDVNSSLSNMDEKIKEFKEDVDKLKKSAQDTPALSKEEITKICDGIVKKAVQDMKLSALAQGATREHANDLFANQVNFFGIGSGAVIDPTYSSNPWEIPKGYYKFRSKQWYQRDGWTTQPVAQALSPWSEEGECFCAGPKAWGLREETVSVHVMMSRSIIPEHLVVEHILPGSTLDPGSRPREIEVWAYYEEMTLRDEVRVFSETNFPNTEPEKKLNEAYLKVGHFVYENVETGDGVQIFRFSDELAQMRGHTSSLVVRAINNYGADHTCFYRLRVYGEIVETEPWKEWGGRE